MLITSVLTKRTLATSTVSLKCLAGYQFPRNLYTSRNERKSFVDAVKLDVKSIPKSALYLGFGGAVPFLSLALASSVTNEYSSIIASGQVSYAACILTFLGAIHWGAEISTNGNPDQKRMVYSVIPSLYAWSAFALPPNLALYYLSVGLVGVAAIDLNDTSFPTWYKKLRIPLTLLAATSVGITGYNLS